MLLFGKTDIVIGVMSHVRNDMAGRFMILANTTYTMMFTIFSHLYILVYTCRVSTLCNSSV